MIASGCFLTIVVAPVVLLLLVAGETLLALILFSDENVEFEFVGCQPPAFGCGFNR